MRPVLSWIALPISLLALSSSQAEPVVLRWKVAPGQLIAYQYYNAEDPKLAPPDIGQLVQDTSLPLPLLTSLPGLHLPSEPNLYLLVRGLPDKRLSVLCVQSSGGAIQTRAMADSSGDLSTFFLQEKERNLMNALLALPRGPIRVGDSWSLPDSHWLTIAGPFRAERAMRRNHVQLTALGKDNLGRWVATLDYVIAEQVLGHPDGSAEGSHTQWMEASMIARSEFLVDQGRWKRFSGRMDFSSNVSGNQATHQLFVLVPLAPVPERLDLVR